MIFSLILSEMPLILTVRGAVLDIGPGFSDPKSSRGLGSRGGQMSEFSLICE